MVQTQAQACRPDGQFQYGKKSQWQGLDTIHGLGETEGGGAGEGGGEGE